MSEGVKTEMTTQIRTKIKCSCGFVGDLLQNGEAYDDIADTKPTKLFQNSDGTYECLACGSPISAEKEITIYCNNCHEPLTEEELKDYSIQWQHSGDMYCAKCRKKFGLGKHDRQKSVARTKQSEEIKKNIQLAKEAYGLSDEDALEWAKDEDATNL